MSKVDLKIGRILIEGLSPPEQRRFGAELEAQLQRLAEDGLLTQSAGRLRKTIAALNAGVLRPGATAAEAAAQIANSIVLHVNAEPPTRPLVRGAVAPRGESHKHG